MIALKYIMKNFEYSLENQVNLNLAFEIFFHIHQCLNVRFLYLPSSLYWDHLAQLCEVAKHWPEFSPTHKNDDALPYVSFLGLLFSSV